MFNTTGRCDGTCDTCECPPAKETKVVDLAQQKHKRLTLDAFDRMERGQTRQISDERAEVERNARGRL